MDLDEIHRWVCLDWRGGASARPPKISVGEKRRALCIVPSSSIGSPRVCPAPSVPSVSALGARFRPQPTAISAESSRTSTSASGRPGFRFTFFFVVCDGRSNFSQYLSDQIFISHALLLQVVAAGLQLKPKPCGRAWIVVFFSWSMPTGTPKA